jgi:hypothetical protein
VETSDQIDAFWDPSSTEYIGDQPAVAKWVAGHSYYSTDDVATAVNHRRSLSEKLAEKDAGLEFWQTEYSLLSTDYQEGRDPGKLTSIDYGLWLARLMHIDLVDGNATGWDFWTSMSMPAAASHEERFGLLNWYPDPPNATHTDGTYDVAKICWAFGNFSRFVRPGYTRLGTSRSDGLNTIGASTNQLYSAYLSDDESNLVIVAINYDDSPQNLSLIMDNLPSYLSFDSYTAYVTTDDEDLVSYSRQGCYG